MLKIDEGNNLGAARIRLRSLKAVMWERKETTSNPVKQETNFRIIFTPEMKERHTILAPGDVSHPFSVFRGGIPAVGL